jgi:glutamate dehydrogenase
MTAAQADGHRPDINRIGELPMGITAEERKVDLVDRLAGEIRARVAPELAGEVEQFARRYFALVAPDDIVYTSFETLVGAVLSLWEFGANRQPGVAKVRLFNPTVEAHGWGLEHTVVEVVNDDMPFLVDSVTAEINRRERNIHLLLHPVARTRRDAAGNRIPIGGDSPGAIVESYMHLEIDRETDPAEIELIRATLERILEQVRAAVTDWRAMRARLAADIDELASSGPTFMTPEEVEESRAFLRWLDEGNFVFLGFRRYGFESRDGHDYLPADPGSGLGILRKMRPESAERSLEPLSHEDSEYARRKDLLIITKANSRSVIHRSVPLDRVGVKRYDREGNLIGEDRFLGLFTSAAYSRSVFEIPMLRLKAKRTIERAGLDPSSHDGKALVDILETFPRDEIFQITDDDLFEVARGILLLQERHQVALFTRRDIFERFVSCYVYVPRDRYTVDFKERAKAILEEAFDGHDTEIYDHVTDNPLARGLFIVRTTPFKIPDIDVKRVEAFLAEAAQTWTDQLRDALVESKDEEQGIELHRRYKKAFPLGYEARFDASAALYDLDHVENVLAHNNLVVDLYRHRASREYHVKVIHAGDPVPLSEIMPRLENMGVRVLSEVPYDIQPKGATEPIRIRDFSLAAEGMADDLRPVKQKFQEAFIRVWKKEAEDDGFNRLVLGAELDWHEVVILRAYCKYLRQIGVNLSEAYMQQTLAGNPRIAQLLIELFRNNFDPALGDSALRGASAGSSIGMGRRMASLNILAQIEDALEAVSNPDEDRILRLYMNLIDATLRTSYFQRTPDGQQKPALSFKLDSMAVKELPLPRPCYEIFVYSPTMEGIHLRAGKVARGGIRWSDRREDFRTEILGLMKAQNVKNVVIVPMGSKGGFVVKNPSTERAAFQREGVEAYRTLLRGMLDITDNLRGDEVVPPKDVVRRDPDDPYLVVAADKGTATFSDIANAISAEYGFWLGDAFASGGSAGYDHKDMGITARGGWEAVKRHFREVGVDIQSQDFTVVGVGDMSGDVFGNAMLLSPHIRLLGAFNHSHIFVDPNPDAARSLQERQRMFDERLNWDAYDSSLLSPGGGVFPRGAKTLTVSEEVQQLFELPQRAVTPADLMHAILLAGADLLWLGGIGTYVKSSDEAHAAARDKSNDAIRVDGRQLRVRVVGEGANLGFTQAARIEYALHGGRINTDFIDNSAGVDTSDHEVNIKILLYDAAARGELGGIEERNGLLSEMTDEVGALVLRDNYEQTQAISVTQSLGESVLDEQARFMRALERVGKLDRFIEGLPDDDAIAERHAAHLGLTRPEIAVVQAYSKIVLYQELLSSDLPDDPLLADDLLLYFPQQLRGRFRPAIERHKLRREIIATRVTNSMMNRLRPSFVMQSAEETGKSAGDVARAFIIVRQSFDIPAIWSEIEGLDNRIPASAQISMLISVGQLLDRAILWLLRRSDGKLDIASTIAELQPGVTALSERLESVLPASLLSLLRARETKLLDEKIPATLAARIARLDVMSSAMDIVRVARKSTPDASPAQPAAASAPGEIAAVAQVYFGVGARFDLDRLRAGAAAIAAETPWQKAAVAHVIDDLFSYQSTLTTRIIAEEGADSGAPAGAAEAWLAKRPRIVERVDALLHDIHTAATIDLAMLSVVARQLRALVES